MKASPPYTITPTILALVAEIAEFIGRYVLLKPQSIKGKTTII